MLTIARQSVWTGLVVMRGSEIAGKDDAAGAANDGQVGLTWPLVLVAGAVLAGISVYELLGLFVMGLGNTDLSPANVAAGTRAFECGLSAVAMFVVLVIVVWRSRGRQRRMRLAWVSAIILTQIALVIVLIIEARASVPPCLSAICESPHLL